MRMYKRVQTRAELQGYSPSHDMVKPVPDSFIVKGVSTYYNKEGKPSGQWVKSRADDQVRMMVINETIEALKDDIPRVEPIAHGGSVTNDSLVNTYVITDYHLGMLSWKDETGEDWDIKIAEDLLVKWFQLSVQMSPNAKYAVFAQLSDFLHFDGMEALTPASKHLLDADTRFPKLVRVAIRVIRRVINILLNKYEHVHVKMSDANHDPVSQIWLREFLNVLYENEPRITVDTSPNPYTVYEFGNVMLGFHHGHKRGVNNVSEVFASQFREIYGRTKYTYIHTGHMHHKHVKENPMMVVEQHRTLAPSDAYSARGGWLSGRDAQVITYHKLYGECGRITVSSDM